MLINYHGNKVDVEDLSKYEQWAMTFFHDRNYLLDPNAGITLQLDITNAGANYNQNYKSIAGSSMTAFLTWQVINILKDSLIMEFLIVWKVEKKHLVEF